MPPASVQRVVSKLDGVESCEVNLVTEKMTVSYDEAKTGPADFKRAVERAGFGISPEAQEKAAEKRPEKKSKKRLFGAYNIRSIIGGAALCFNGANDGEKSTRTVFCGYD